MRAARRRRAGLSVPGAFPALGDSGVGSPRAKELQGLKTRRRMARERRGAGSSLVSMETQF